MSITIRRSGGAALRALAATACLLTLNWSIEAAPGPQSSPIALSTDNTRLVNVNPSANTLSIFDVTGNNPVKLNEVLVGQEPVSVAVAGTSAYVANSASNSVSVVNIATGQVVGNIAVGSEPMGVVAGPNGSRVYVANSSSNSVTVINPFNNSVITTINLANFGSSPRAMGITNNGDANDADEVIFVAMFFGQLRPGKTALEEGQDDQREGRIVAIPVATNAPAPTFNPINLGPLANAGFNANGRLAPAVNQTPSVPSTNPQTFTTPTGAYPNQLAAVALHPNNNRTYVVSTAASPNGPLRFNHMAQGLVSVFNTLLRTEITAGQTGAGVRQTAPLNLNQGVNLSTTPLPKLFLTNPVAMAWRPDGSDAWVVVQNTNVVVRLTVDAGGIPTIGNPLVAGPSQVVRVDLENSPVQGLIPGTAPQGIAINSAGTRAFVANFTSRSISVIDITNPGNPAIIGTSQSTPLPAAGTINATALLGAQLFFTGRGPQERMSSESWGGCIVCHPNGRSDNVTWMFDAGPRQTIPLDGMFSKSNPNDQRILNWSAVRDENHDFELNTRGVFGGRGLIDDDRLFFAIGGNTATGETGQIAQFNQATGSVGTTNDLLNGNPLPTMNAFGPRRDFATATLSDGRIFIIGGRSGAGQGNLITGANTILEFNPRKKGLIPRSSTGFTPRHSLGAAAVRTNRGFRIYAIGGYPTTSAAVNPINFVQEYNPATDTWRTVASLPEAVAQFGIAVSGGHNTAEPRQLIHVVGGNYASDAVPNLISLNPIQRFQADPAGPGVWTTFNPAGLTPRRNLGAATVLRGVQSRVFVIGGMNAANIVLDTVEEYQAQAVTMVNTPHTSVQAPRASFGISSSLSTNQIYVIGGLDGTFAAQTSVLEYTIGANGPVAGPPGTPSGTWVKRGDLSSARVGLGVNTPPGVTNFNPVRSAGRDARQDAIAVWISQKVRAARAPVPVFDPLAQNGRSLFGQVGLTQAGFSCATCHAGAKWTRSGVDYQAPPSPDTGIGLGNSRIIGAELRRTSKQGPDAGQLPGVLINVGTFALNGRANEVRFNGADISQAVAPLGANGFNIPSLLSVHETAPYYYSGTAQTLDQVLNGSQDNTGGVRHHFVQDAQQRAALVQFLRSIDQTTPIFP